MSPTAEGWHIGISVTLSLTLALALSCADYEMARVHRTIARESGAWLKGWQHKVRYGAEWGLRHYLGEQGFKQFISTSDDMRAGDLVLSPHEAIPYRLPQDVESMSIPVATKSWTSRFPLRTMNRAAHAGFYSSGWGLLPFAFSSSAVETLNVVQVSMLVEELPDIVIEKGIGDSPIPWPAPGGGVDLLVPIPSSLSIPYRGPFPAQVLFDCLVYDPTESPVPGKPREPLLVQVFYREATAKAGAELPLTVLGDNGSHRFQLPQAKAGWIVLRIGDGYHGRSTSRAVLRNWRILPPREAFN